MITATLTNAAGPNPIGPGNEITPAERMPPFAVRFKVRVFMLSRSKNYKMAGPDTDSIPATVMNVVALRDRSDRVLIGPTVSRDVFPYSSVADMKDCIPARPLSSTTFPTAAFAPIDYRNQAMTFIYLTPKSSPIPLSLVYSARGSFPSLTRDIEEPYTKRQQTPNPRAFFLLPL